MILDLSCLLAAEQNGDQNDSPAPFMMQNVTVTDLEGRCVSWMYSLSCLLAAEQNVDQNDSPAPVMTQTVTVTDMEGK